MSLLEKSTVLYDIFDIKYLNILIGILLSNFASLLFYGKNNKYLLCLILLHFFLIVIIILIKTAHKNKDRIKRNLKEDNTKTKDETIEMKARKNTNQLFFLLVYSVLFVFLLFFNLYYGSKFFKQSLKPYNQNTEYILRKIDSLYSLQNDSLYHQNRYLDSLIEQNNQIKDLLEIRDTTKTNNK